MKAKFTNLEAHSRRNNLIIVGLEEGLESGNPEKMVNDILRYIMDLKDDDPVPEVERHHRNLRPRLTSTEPQRPYLVCKLRWTDRQKILGAAAKKRQLSEENHSGCTRIYQRRSKESAQNTMILEANYGEQTCAMACCPARLIVTIDGSKYSYNSASEAAEDLRRKLPKVFG